MFSVSYELNIHMYSVARGYAVAQLVQPLRYEPKCAVSIPSGVSRDFSLTMTLGSTQPLIEISTRDLPWRVK